MERYMITHTWLTKRSNFLTHRRSAIYLLIAVAMVLHMTAHPYMVICPCFEFTVEVLT